MFLPGLAGVEEWVWRLRVGAGRWAQIAGEATEV